MKNKIRLTLTIVLVLGSAPIFANSTINFKALDFIGNTHFDSGSAWQQPFTVKKGGYDESKDPALRRGTENWEEPQGSFFIIPAAVVVVIGLFLFFSREK